MLFIYKNDYSKISYFDMPHFVNSSSEIPRYIELAKENNPCRAYLTKGVACNPDAEIINTTVFRLESFSYRHESIQLNLRFYLQESLCEHDLKEDFLREMSYRMCFKTLEYLITQVNICRD